MPFFSGAVDALRSALGFSIPKSADSSGQYLPRTSDAPADSEIRQYEELALERLNAATLDADPGSVASGLPLTNMTAADSALTRLSDVLTGSATSLDALLTGTDEQLARTLRGGDGGTVISQLEGLAATASGISGPVQAAGDARNGMAQRLSALASDAKSKIEAYTTSGGSKGAPVFDFDWSGGEFVALGDQLATDIIPELHNLANPDDPIRGVANIVPLLSGGGAMNVEKALVDGGLSTSEAHSIAERFITTGLPYSWGGGHGAAPGPTLGVGDGGGDADTYGDAEKIGLDCSGLSRSYTYDAYGVDIGPGSTYDQYANLKDVGADGRKPGDLYFPPDGNGGVNLEHVQVYLGDGTVLEARESGTKLTLSPLEEGGDYRRPDVG